MPNINPGDAVSVTCFGRLQGQRILNVFHYGWASTAAGDYDTELQNLLVNFRSIVCLPAGPGWLNMCTTDFAVEFYRAQTVHPARLYYQQLTPNTPDAGVGTPPTVPSDVNAVIGLRTLSAIRGTVGNKKITGMPTTDLDGNRWSAPAMTSYFLQTANMLTILNNIAMMPVWIPIVWSKKRAGDRRAIVAVGPRPEVRVLRSREFGKGV